MQGLLIALRAIFADLHFVGMGPLVAGRDVVFVAADGALEDHLIAFACHLSSHSICSAAIMLP